MSKSKAERPTIAVFVSSAAAKSIFSHLQGTYRLIFFTIRTDIHWQEYVRRVCRTIRQRGIELDGVVGFSDQSALIASVVAENLGLVGPSPMAVYKAQHKARFSEICTNLLPHFPATFVVDEHTTVQPNELRFPAFIKPVRGMMSRHARKVLNWQEVITHVLSIGVLQQRKYGWFDDFVAFVGDEVTVSSYVVQEFCNGEQYSVDGFVQNGVVSIIGFVKTVFDANRQSFIRFDYPADLRNIVQEQVIEILNELTSKLGYDNAGFCMEFFLSATENIIPIEFNTRVALQFSPLYAARYAITPVEMMLQLATDMRPNLQMENKSQHASSCVLRMPQDCLLTKAPTKEALEQLKSTYGVKSIWFIPTVGSKLSDSMQDEYTYRYGLVTIERGQADEIYQVFAEVEREIRDLTTWVPV